MAVSRSPKDFMRRKERVPTVRPGPRFSPGELLVHKYALGPSLLKSRQAEGVSPPDRPILKPWFPATENNE